MQPVEQQDDPQISNILEACRLRLAAGESVDDCLAAFPSYRHELASLLPLVVQVQSLTQNPGADYTSRAWAGFHSTLAAARENRAQAIRASYRGPFGFLRRLAGPFTPVLIVLMSGLGIVQVSDLSLPDNPLYSVKQATESFGLLLARTPHDRAQLQIRNSNRRLKDFQLAVKAGKQYQLLEAIGTSMADEADRAADSALTSDVSRRPELIAELGALLPKERMALYILVSNPRPLVSQYGDGLQQQILADEVKLTAVK